jgi:copper oxidase (laccase) domain-containing protein
VHGAGLVVVTQPAEHAGAEADAAVTQVPGCKLAVRTADCVPIVLAGERCVAVVHAGWRGLAAGVVQATIDAMHGDVIAATIGPHIRVGCYEFGTHDLDQVSAALGDHVRGTTTWGAPALDLTMGTRVALGDLPVDDAGACTACSHLYFSWRARKETARFATIAWMS